MHKIIYLPSVEKDLVSAVDYLADTLGSVQAAENLLQEFEATVERIAQFQYANALYRTDRPIDHEIRKVAVKNYILYYTVLAICRNFSGNCLIISYIFLVRQWSASLFDPCILWVFFLMAVYGFAFPNVLQQLNYLKTAVKNLLQ